MSNSAHENHSQDQDINYHLLIKFWEKKLRADKFNAEELTYINKRLEYQYKVELKLGHKKYADYLNKLRMVLSDKIDHNKATEMAIGLEMAEEVASIHKEIGTQPVAALKSFLGSLNIRRMHFARGGGLISGILSQLPTQFMNTANAQKAMKAPHLVAGVVSWVFYYFRLALSLFLVAKHTVSGDWLTEEEKQEGDWKKRLAKQWQSRKLLILNDLMWSTVNLACFFWLVGSGVVGQIGGVLTAACLLLDLWITIMRFNQELQEKKELLRNLEEQLTNLNTNPDHNRTQINLLQQEIAHVKNEIKFIKEKKLNEMVFCVGMFVGFLMLSSMFIPPNLVPLSMSVVPMVGSIICFLSFVVWQYLDCKTEENKEGIDPEEKKISEMNTIKSTLINTLSPIVSFAIMVFIPMPPIASAFAALGCALAISLLIKAAFSLINPAEKTEQEAPPAPETQ